MIYLLKLVGVVGSAATQSSILNLWERFLLNPTSAHTRIQEVSRSCMPALDRLLFGLRQQIWCWWRAGAFNSEKELAVVLLGQ